MLKRILSLYFLLIYSYGYSIQPDKNYFKKCIQSCLSAIQKKDTLAYIKLLSNFNGFDKNDVIFKLEKHIKLFDQKLNIKKDHKINVKKIESIDSLNQTFIYVKYDLTKGSCQYENSGRHFFVMFKLNSSSIYFADFFYLSMSIRILF